MAANIKKNSRPNYYCNDLKSIINIITLIGSVNTVSNLYAHVEV